MLFSILIPIYNVEKYLEECLNSIVIQTFTDYEIILVDDGSSDRSGEICDSFQEQHQENTVVIHQMNQGLLMARREAFKHAKGLYYVCCDADDVLSKDALEKLSEIIGQKHPDIIQYDLYLFDEKEKIENINQENVFQDRVIYDNINLLRNYLIDRTYNIWSMAGKCISRKCIDNSIDYSQLKSIQYGEDTLQSIEVYDRANNFLFISDKIYYYRSYSGMMKCLPHKYCQDFFAISDILKKYIGKWKITDSLLVDYFVLKISYDYMLHTFDQHLSYSQVKEKMLLLAEDIHFSSAYMAYNRAQKIRTPLTKKMKLVLELVNKHDFLVLFFLIKIRELKQVRRERIQT